MEAIIEILNRKGFTVKFFFSGGVQMAEVYVPENEGDLAGLSVTATGRSSLEALEACVMKLPQEP